MILGTAIKSSGEGIDLDLMDESRKTDGIECWNCRFFR